MRGRAFVLGVGLTVGVGCALALGGWIRHRSDQLRRTRATVGALANPANLEVAEVAYDGKLAPGWEDWGWGPHDIPEAGVAKVQFGGFGGLVLRHEELPPRFGGVRFRFRAPPDYPDFLDVRLQYQQRPESELPRVQIEPKYVTEAGDGWKEAFVPWAVLDPQALPFDRIAIQANRLVGSDWILIDRVVLTKQGTVAETPTPVRQARLAIECDKPATPINPLIYGISQGEWSTGETAHRIGGNPMSRLNWELSAWNTANDWFFENVKDTSTLENWIDETHAKGGQIAVVVPMIGWVAKDTTSVGFSTAQFGVQKAHDPKRPQAGDGRRPDGKLIPPGPPTTTSVPAPPEVIKTWTKRLRDDGGKPRKIEMYILDNEPNLWHITHRDVHPLPITYDELLDRTIRYGTAIREADPDAVIAGPAEWGWSGYFFSARDTSEGGLLHSDRDAHGGVPLLPWYLQRLADHEKRTGVRILDVVDVHFYPQAPGVYGGGERTDAEAAALRIRTTRALWDPSYRDESWIKEHVNLIPRIKDWIAKNYPGRGVSIGEWNFGGEDHISGALAIAEALGRFGQQGITSAFYWAKLRSETRGFQAFRAFRNFDGKGGRFLDRSVPTQTEDGVSFFASTNDSTSHIVAVVLNLDPVSAVQVGIDVTKCGRATQERAFRYGPDVATLTEEPGKTGGSKLVEVIAPYSLKVLDLVIERK
jgi:Glycoside hydrolase family 44